MKTIQIPTTSNPFIVSINNHVYTYRAGSTVEVPDEVAAAIEDALELVPKPKRNPSQIAQIANGTITEITASDLEGIGTIAYYAFYSCPSLARIEIPDSVTSIGEGAFYNCKSLTSVVIPHSVKTIGTNAFTACKLLKTVRFGEDSSLESIGSDAFQWCSVLERVYLPDAPPTLANVGAFQNINKDCVFYCKTQASLEAYKAVANWSTLTGTYTFVVEA